MHKPILTTVILASALLAACGPTPESVCEVFIAGRKAGEWPASDAVQKECVKEVEAAQKRSPESFDCLRRCVGGKAESSGADFAKNSSICIAMNCNEKDPENKDRGLWSLGIASESSGAWAGEKPKKLGAEECNEGAFAISRIKYQFGLLKDSSEWQKHQVDLGKACNESKSDPAYAAQFACLRRVTKQDEILKCSQGGGSGPGPGGASADVIEGCVTECSGKHGRDASPAYMACFDECKTRGK